MSGPLQSLADPMSTYNTSMRFLQAERERIAKLNREYEESSTSSESEPECKGQDKEKQSTPKQIEYRRDVDRMCDELARERRERWDAAHKKLREGSFCTIL